MSWGIVESCLTASWTISSSVVQHGVPLGVLVVAEFRGRPPRLALSVAR
jgi:hypothetical protein